MTKISLAAATAASAVVLAACGSSSNSSSKAPPAASTRAPAATSTSSGSPSTSTPSSSTPSSSAAAPPSSPSGTVQVAADPSGGLKFIPSSLTAKAGEVSIAFTNSSSLGHNLTIASPSGSVIAATPTFQGGTKTISVNLKPGSYTFYCSVPGHREAGMQGTLVVR
jgi:plastocyanin